MPLVNESELDWTEHDGVEGAFRTKRLGDAAGSDALGATLYEVPPGSQPVSYHYHAANEEAIYVLSGTGTLRLDGESFPLGEGEYVAFPADPSGAHCVVNDDDETLRYLAFSTMRDPDVTVHPDDGVFGVYVGAPPGSDEKRTLSGFYDVDDAVTPGGDD